MRLHLHAIAGCLVLAATPAPAHAQGVERPGDVRPELPAFEPERGEGEPLLPPVPPSDEGAQLSAGAELLVREYRITGATAFSEEELRRVAAPWTNRRIRTEDLIGLRNALTRFYVSHGYLNSGAIVPDQVVREGVVEVRIIEGSLSDVEVTGNRYYRAGPLRRRLALGAGTPLDVARLEERLQLLQQDDRIQRVRGRLVPGERPGEAILQVEVEEALPYRVWAEFDNHEPPSIGAMGGSVGLAHENLLGFGDTLSAEFAATKGLRRYEGHYAFPFTAWGTALLLDAEYSESSVEESPFDELDIDSDYQSYGVGIRHPVYRSMNTELALGVRGEWRRSTNALLGSPFSFPGSGAENGRTKVSVLRFVQEWLRRERRMVFAARSTVTWGLDVLGATDATPDGEFVAWLGQFQWAGRFGGVETLFRTDVQLSSDALPSLEQFAVGGHDSVRGYRENQLVRDQGVVSSVEVRLPLWRMKEGVPVLQLAPFFDLGHSWNRNRGPGSRTTLASLGVGLRWRVNRFADAQIYWGHDLNGVPTDGNLQDDGVSFRLTVHWP